MSVSLREVVDAFELLYASLIDRNFRKSLRMTEWGERKLLPITRSFLLGYFGQCVEAEVKARLPGSLSGDGRLDFIIDNVAVELAVRKPLSSRSALSAVVNNTELKN